MQETDITVALHPSEVANNMYDAPITAASIFQGEPPADFLQDRASRILAANPWLASRLVTDEGTGIPCFRYPVNPTLSPFFEQVDMAQVCASGTTVDSLLAESFAMPLSPAMAALFTRHGFNSLDADEPLCKIRLCTGSDGRFAILLSMSHILGDGFTFNRIHRMLAPSASVESLTPQRVEAFPEIAKGTGGLPGSLWFPRSESADGKHKWLLESNAIWHTAETRAAVGLSKEGEEDVPAKDRTFGGGLFRVDKEWVAEQKRCFEGDGETNWISTNDILTSWFLTRSKADMGAMAINARNRASGLGPQLAGNYQLGFLLHPDEYSTPAAIRRAVTAFSADTRPGSAPGPGDRLALISSWTQTHADLDFGPGSRQLLYIPLAPPELNPPVLLDALMILFRCGNGGLAVALKSSNFEDYFDNTALGAPLLG